MGLSGCGWTGANGPLDMKTPLFLIWALVSAPLFLAPARAQTSTTTETTSTMTTQGIGARQAYDIAKDGVDASLRARVVSLYGTGTPAGIQTWWVIFYDPSVPSHGRAVRVENGQITRTYEAKGGVVYGDTLTFDPGQITGLGKALTAAENYAAQHAIAYSHVRALLRLTTADSNIRWRIQLLNGAHSKGFVFVNANDGSFAMYAPAGSHHDSGGTGSVEGDAKAAGNDIKNTFLGIGGDLQEFFTGERTVDQ
jgi:hypothetical protein